jgi:serine protease
MKSRYSIVTLTIGILLSLNNVEANSTNIESVLANCHQPYFPGELLIKFKAGVSMEDAKSVHSHLEVSKVREGYKGCYQIIEVVPGEEKEMLRTYSQRPEVEYAEPNYYHFIQSTPNDEFYPLQWHLPLINLEEAWDKSTGKDVTVAVLDTGVNPRGPDGFGKRVLRGYNAILKIPGGCDYNYHGTHVAGTIGQETNNMTGVAGIAYDARILPVKVLCGPESVGTSSWISDGIRWATDHGADIINLSLGSAYLPQVVEDAVNYAYGRGVTLVASAGNDGESRVIYPAAFENCIAVGAMRYDKTLTHYSNYGDDLELVAPGGDLNVDQNSDGYGDGVFQETFERSWFICIKWGYWFATGTSMSSPHVAGVAALVKSLHPEYGPDEIRQVLQETAEDLGDPGWDEKYGYGLIDANAAVSY